MHKVLSATMRPAWPQTGEVAGVRLDGTDIAGNVGNPVGTL